MKYKLLTSAPDAGTEETTYYTIYDAIEHAMAWFADGYESEDGDDWLSKELDRLQDCLLNKREFICDDGGERVRLLLHHDVDERGLARGVGSHAGIPVSRISSLLDKSDPRGLFASGAHGRDIHAFVWRGVVYYRDDKDKETPDSLETSYSSRYIDRARVLPCIVTNDGFRFKPADQKDKRLITDALQRDIKKYLWHIKKLKSVIEVMRQGGGVSRPKTTANPVASQTKEKKRRGRNAAIIGRPTKPDIMP